MEERIRQRLTQAIHEGVFPGAVVGCIDNLENKMVIPVGGLTYDKDAEQVTENSMYDVASITKAIPVSMMAIALIEQNKLSLHRPIAEIIPELQTNYREGLTVWHLLTQTVAYDTSLATLKDASADQILSAILSTQFSTPPGHAMNYANATSILLGLVIERVTGMTLDSMADSLFFKPLGMHDTSFHPQSLPGKQIVPTEDDTWRKRRIQGEVHDESAYRLNEKQVVGSAGLFSTAPNLLLFLQMMVQKGMYNGKRYFSEEMLKQLSENQLTEIGEIGGLGWELNQTRYMGEHCSPRTIGKTGFTGCVIMIDTEKNKGLVFLSNYHFPTRKDTASSLNSVRRDISGIVFAS